MIYHRKTDLVTVHCLGERSVPLRSPAGYVCATLQQKLSHVDLAVEGSAVHQSVAFTVDLIHVTHGQQAK